MNHPCTPPNQKLKPRQITLILRFRIRYRSYSGPLTRNAYLAKFLEKNCINICTSHARLVMRSYP